MKSVTVAVKMCVMIVLLILLCSANALEPEQMTEQQLVLSPIGSVHKEKGYTTCLLYTSPSPRDATLSRMPSSA